MWLGVEAGRVRITDVHQHPHNVLLGPDLVTVLADDVTNHITRALSAVGLIGAAHGATRKDGQSMLVQTVHVQGPGPLLLAGRFLTTNSTIPILASVLSKYRHLEVVEQNA